MFTIVIKPAAENQMDRLPGNIRARVLAALENLREDPRPPKAVKVSGQENTWRIRVGDYRVVYEVHGDVLMILVVGVAHRKDVYRGW